jgi:hypothetical protein
MNFFERMLQRKQALYDEGINKARYAYNSVLSAPLSDEANIPLRDQYIKQAKDRLKTMSSLDFSLPQNVQAAEGIFSPFWEDDKILKDANITKWYQSQYQTLDNWRYSSDPKVRNQYSGISQMYLDNELDKLRKAGRSDEVYNSIQKRRAVPFTNIQEYLEDMASKEPNNLKISWSDPSGPYLVNTTNGQRSEKNFEAWARGMIGSNFFDQFNTTGIVEREQRAKGIRAMHPGENLTDQQVLDIMSKDVISELGESYKKRMNNIDVEVAKIDTLISSIPVNGSEKEQATFNSLIEERKRLTADRAGIDQDYKYFDSNDKDVIRRNVLASPDGYFATLAKERTIQSWSTARASAQQVEVKSNEAYFNAENLRMRNAEYNLAVAKENREREQMQWEQNHPNAGKGKTTTISKDKDGNIVLTEGSAEGQDESGSLVYRGPSGVDITKNAVSAHEAYSKNQERLFNSANSMIFDQKGLLLFAKNLGISESELSHVATALQSEVVDPKATNFTKEQTDATNKLGKLLLASEGVKKAGITKIEGPGGMRNALVAYSQEVLEMKNKAAADGKSTPLDDKEYEALIRYSTAIANLAQYAANDKKRDQLVTSLYGTLKNQKDKNLIVDDGKGGKQIITASQLAETKEFKELANNLWFKENIPLPNYALPGMPLAGMGVDIKGKVDNKKLGSKELAQEYLAGKLKINYYEDKSGHNKALGSEMATYAEVEYQGRTYHLFNNGVPTAKKVLEMYGDSKEANSNYNKILNQVTPNYLMYQNQTGRQSSEFTMVFKPGKTMAQGDNAAKILDEALSVGNAEEMYTYDKNKKPIVMSPEQMDAIRSILSSEKNMEELLTARYVPQGIDGKRTIHLTFHNPIASDSNLQIKGVDLKTLTGVDYSIVIKDNTNAPALNNLPNSTGMQVFDAILRGQTIKSDPIINASGTSFEVVPNNTSNPTYVTVNMNWNERKNVKDPKTGAVESKMVPMSKSQTINLSGDNSKTPDEIMNYLYLLYQQNMTANRQTMVEYNNYMQNNPSAVTFDKNAELRRLGLNHLIK